MNALLVSDLHLTDNPRDEYRWGLFPWLVDTCQHHGVKELFILGDLCESKDYHSARLVNRIVDSLLKLYRQGGLLKIIILRGNHDGTDPSCPYFRFVGSFPWAEYITTPYMFPSCGKQILLLPHTTDPETAWKDCGMRDADYVFMHATVHGAKGENGFELRGVPMILLRDAARAKVWSGDVHVPQKIGPVEYVGAPYPIKFGDAFKGRVVLLEDYKKAIDISFPTIQRLVITLDPSDDSMVIKGGDDAFEKDQAKFRVRLAPQDYLDWHKLKDQVVTLCREVGLELCGMELERVQVKRPRIGAPVKAAIASSKTPDDVFLDYCIETKLTEEVAAFGADLLVAAHGEASSN